MSIEPHLVFYDSRVLGQEGSLESIIDLLQKEYELVNFRVGNLLQPDAQWGTNFQIDNLEKAYEKNNISFKAKNKKVDLELLVHLTWNIDLGDGKKHAYVGVVTFQTAYFYQDNKKAVEYSKRLLDFGKTLYSKVLPDFGWIDFQEPAGLTWFDEIELNILSQVYWANFVGASYITKYGINGFLNAPAWHTETLNDQGCLIVLSAVLGQQNNTEVMREYLIDLLQK